MEHEYKVYNDGYGHLSAKFPAVYPEEYLESDVSDTLLKQRIDAILKTLTLEEKVSLLSADGMMGQDTSTLPIEKRYCTGYWKGAARVGVPVLRCYDGPMGVIGTSGSETTKPSSEISVACTFDRNLAERYGALYARDNKASAGNMQLGIQTDLLRTLADGRARDMFGEDWYLEGQIASAMAKGLEKNHVLACLKHCGGMGNIDEQTMMETNLSVYENVMKQDRSAHAVMTNYSSTNGQQACADSYIIKKVFRELWGWDGIVLTDWGGNYQFTVDKGITLETPCVMHNHMENVQKALESGTLQLEDIDAALAHDLYALGKIGYLGLVQISRDGTAASDSTSVNTIELDEPAHRYAILDQSGVDALEIAQAGMVLLKNNDNVLPLDREDRVALIGFSGLHTVAGHASECAFGRLSDLSVSAYDALSSSIREIEAYPGYDIIGMPIPSEYLYTDSSCTHHGAVRTGTDGFGKDVSCIDPYINFTTNSTNYLNAKHGSAFPYGTQGAKLAWNTWLQVPESGTYVLKAEAAGATDISAQIEINGTWENIGAAGGRIASGLFGSTGLVSTETGLDVPEAPPDFPMESPFGEDFELPDFVKNVVMVRPGKVEFYLEKGKVYPIRLSIDGHFADQYNYMIGKKDLQIRLAWITPDQRDKAYSQAIDGAAAPNTTVLLFAHVLGGSSIDDQQQKLLSDALAAAKCAGNKTVLVLTNAQPVDLAPWADRCDAILAAWLPGQTGGTAIANVLTGVYAPSGRLSVTWPRNFDADQTELNIPGRGLASKAPHPSASYPTEIREGIFSGYKWYDATDRQEAVMYDFGYGLSYTTFSQHISSVTPFATGADDYGFDVRVQVKNTGARAGREVVQLYLAAPGPDQVKNAVYDPFSVAESFHYTDETGAPTKNMEESAYFPKIDGIQFAPRQLCGFAKTEELAPGEETTVTIHISQRSLSYWNSEQSTYTQRRDGTKDKWTVVAGTRTLILGKNSDEAIETQELHVVPAEAGTKLRIEAPERAMIYGVCCINAVADENTIGLTLSSSDGRMTPPKHMNILRSSGKSSWELIYQFDRAGIHTYHVMQKTWNGWANTGIEIQIDVVDPLPELLHATAKTEVIYGHTSAILEVEASSNTSEIEITDEKGELVTISETETEMLVNGVKHFTLTLPPFSPGIGQILSLKAISCAGNRSQNSLRISISVLI